MIYLSMMLSFLMTANVVMAEQPSRGDTWQEEVRREVDHALNEKHLEVWYPRVVDEEYGGYLSNFTRDWRLQGSQDKFVVSQARHVWTSAKAAKRYPHNSVYERASRHGAEFLIARMWDHEYGGFFETLTREGELKETAHGQIGKRAYGNAFAIYGLAAYFDATGDSTGLDAAVRAFRWLDEHSHDPVHGGYFQFMHRDGEVIREGQEGRPPKDQNSSIHLLEAFTELYQVWPDPVLRQRLEELLLLVRDRIVTDRGYMNLFFSADWKPVVFADSAKAVREAHYDIDHVSFGHDIETAFLLLEASEVLYGAPDEATLDVARRMTDHALAYGWDHAVGGIFDRGYYVRGATEPEIILPSKTWWAQAEALNTLLIMAKRFGNEETDYAKLFRTQWEYVKKYLIDDRYGGWYGGGLDREPERKTMSKAHQWKAAYHDGRALMHVLDLLAAD